MDSLAEFWRALGPTGPCAVLFFIGCLLIVGFFRNWKWLYPSHKTVRNYHPGIRRVLVLVGGIVLVVCTIVFYIFRDSIVDEFMPFMEFYQNRFAK